LNTIIEDTTLTNEARSTQVEEYMINEATTLGVVKKIEIKAAKNPNKWGKHLTPWYTPQCKEAKHDYIHTRNIHGRHHPATAEAFKHFRRQCLLSRHEYSLNLPNILKYKPK
jgi:hypothetical protein